MAKQTACLWPCDPVRRAERELYHVPVKEATESTQEAHVEGNSEQPPLQMTDGKPPGLGRSSRARYGRDRRDRRRPLDGAAEKADGEHAADVAPQDGARWLLCLVFMA